MRQPARVQFLTVVAVAVVVLSPTVAAGQTEASSSPKTAWRRPDLGGIWDFRTMTPLERPRDLSGKAMWTAEEAAAYERQTLERRERRALSPGSVHAAWWLDNGTELTANRRTSLIVDPPDGRIPALMPKATRIQEAQARSERPVRLRQSRNSSAHGPEDLGIGERCLLGFSSGPPITPSAYNNNLMVFQTPDYVVLLTEMVHEARIVPLDGRPHISKNIPQWLGDSRGHWDGATLVVESVNFTDKIGSFSTLGVAVGSGDTLHLIERFTRVDADTLLYEFTIDDPTTFAQPFTAAVPMKWTTAPLYEFACHEGNRGLVGMLRGARAVEKTQPSDVQSK